MWQTCGRGPRDQNRDIHLTFLGPRLQRSYRCYVTITKPHSASLRSAITEWPGSQYQTRLALLPDRLPDGRHHLLNYQWLFQSIKKALDCGYRPDQTLFISQSLVFGIQHGNLIGHDKISPWSQLDGCSVTRLPLSAKSVVCKTSHLPTYLGNFATAFLTDARAFINSSSVVEEDGSAHVTK